MSSRHDKTELPARLIVHPPSLFIPLSFLHSCNGTFLLHRDNLTEGPLSPDPRPSSSSTVSPPSCVPTFPGRSDLLLAADPDVSSVHIVVTHFNSAVVLDRTNGVPTHLPLRPAATSSTTPTPSSRTTMLVYDKFFNVKMGV
ncbi:hypothetical protein NL676_018466 [Syzygium grande]|nr:hypothetical protein NL676_018466 [Syzygium grande]